MEGQKGRRVEEDERVKKGRKKEGEDGGRENG